MATATVPSPASPSPSPPAPVSGSSLGLFWGGGMLVIFSLWLGKLQFDITPMVLGFLWVLAVGGIGAGIWYALTLNNARLAGGHEVLDQRRQLLGRGLIGAGVILEVIGVYLAYTLRLPGFAESVGLCLFGLIPLLAGLGMGTKADAEHLLHAVLRGQMILRNVLFALGGAGIVVFVWLAWSKKLGVAWLPELGALVFGSLLFLTCAFWLATATTLDRTPFAMRCLMLILGGVLGLLLVLMATFRAIFWRQEVLFGGLSVWQGDEHGWKIWLCAYVGMVGLMLMFGSVLLVRSEVRTNASLRQTLYGYNAVATGFLLVAFLVAFNVVGYAMFPFTVEWTRDAGLNTVSPVSKNLLADMDRMKKSVTVYVLLPNVNQFADLRTLLVNCQAISSGFQVKHISTDRDKLAYEELSRRFPDLLPAGGIGRDDEKGRGLLVILGSLPSDTSKSVPHEFIPERSLFGPPKEDKDKVRMELKGEMELMSKISHLIYGQKGRKVYILQGNGELDINEKRNAFRRVPSVPMQPLGAANLVTRLKNDNYEVVGLDLGKERDKPAANTTVEKEVPEDAWVVVVLGASGSKPMPTETIGALQRYMDRGGKLVVTTELVVNNAGTTLLRSGMEAFLAKSGVEVEDKMVVRKMEFPEDDPRFVTALAKQDSENEFAKQFRLKDFQLLTVRPVRPGSAPKFKAEPLLEVYPGFEDQSYWAESDLLALTDPGIFQLNLRRNKLLTQRFSKEPIPVAVMVTEDGARPEDTSKPRLVVFGDTEFLSNGFFAEKRDREIYYSIFVSSLEWLGERKGLLGIRPRPVGIYNAPSKDRVSRMVFLPFWWMILSVCGLGAGVWLVRRR